jgi:hypothetical protein
MSIKRKIIRVLSRNRLVAAISQIRGCPKSSSAASDSPYIYFLKSPLKLVLQSSAKFGRQLILIYRFVLARVRAHLET